MEEIITKKKLREFGLVVGFGLPIIIGFLIPLLFSHNFRIWTLFVACPLLIFAISRPISLLYPYKAWMSLGYLLGKINSNLIINEINVYGEEILTKTIDKIQKFI